MTDSILLVHTDSIHGVALHSAFHSIAGDIGTARSVVDAEDYLLATRNVRLIFTETVLPDGTWADILLLRRGLARGIPVVIVCRWPDVELFADLIGAGAAGCIAPPYSPADLVTLITRIARPVPDAPKRPVIADTGRSCFLQSLARRK